MKRIVNDFLINFLTNDVNFGMKNTLLEIGLFFHFFLFSEDFHLLFWSFLFTFYNIFLTIFLTYQSTYCIYLWLMLSFLLLLSYLVHWSFLVGFICFCLMIVTKWSLFIVVIVKKYLLCSVVGVNLSQFFNNLGLSLMLLLSNLSRVLLSYGLC